jgi:hypothetical protein
VIPSRRTLDLIARLAAAEERFLAGEFLAPHLRGRFVQVRIAGVVCRLAVEPDDFHGWGIFRPRSYTVARLIRPARLTERQRYLSLLPLVRLILCERTAAGWLALPASRSDRRFRLSSPVPVHLVEQAQSFETVECRFDGFRFWFDRLDPRRDPATAAYLRQAFHDHLPPAELNRPGMTAEERATYALLYDARENREQEARRDRTERRLRVALDHAGAEFVGYLEHPDGYRVEYVIDGCRHLSAVGKDDLTILSAGICLSGEDENFDLQSLVGVLRQGQSEGEIIGLEG